jgi:hypothetical protein
MGTKVLQVVHVVKGVCCCYAIALTPAHSTLLVWAKSAITHQTQSFFEVANIFQIYKKLISEL